MRRVEKAFEIRFRTLLVRAKARRLEEGVRWLMGRAAERSTEEGVPAVEALLDLYSGMVSRPYFRERMPLPEPVRFVCDSGLGGLARWLRAAGYEAWWRNPVEDDVLLEVALENGCILITTDSLLMERRVVRNGELPVLWLPPLFNATEQLRRTMRHFELEPRESRCMACGGELAKAVKEELRERIPPKTFAWRDEYFVCRACNRLYWLGTHWERIQKELGKLAA